MMIKLRLIGNVILSLGYLVFLSRIDDLLKTLTTNPRTLLIFQGMAWLTLTILINGLTSKNLYQYLRQRFVLVGFLFVFVYFLGSGIFFNTKLFMIANFEAYWLALILVNYSLYTARIISQKLPIRKEGADIIIYYLWLMFFIFCLFFPALFAGPYLAVLMGPFFIIGLVIYTNRRSNNSDVVDRD